MTNDSGTKSPSPSPGHPAPGHPEQVIAVTGSAGFLGAHLVGLLEDSPRIARVVSLDATAPSTAGWKTRHFELHLAQNNVEEQLAEILAAEKVTALVHLAFLPGPTHRPQEGHYLESVGTMHVVNACRRARVNKLVMGSQTFLYGASPKNPCFLEEHKPLLAPPSEAYFRDKIQAERDVMVFGRPGRGRITTILRFAPVVGPRIDNFVTRYLSQRFVPTILGFDPLWQFLHEADAAAALKRAIDVDVIGVFNVSGDGVVPLSKAIRLVGRRSIPLTRPVAEWTMGALWVARRGAIPSSFLDHLQYSCVGDCERTRKVLGFSPLYSSQKALLDFGAAQNLRDVRLLSETPA